MSWFKKGPELKLSGLKPSELKVPPFLSDLYWDLRDRRLLPFVALAIVAIVAVPFLLGSGSKSSPPAPTLGIASPSAEPLGSGSSSLTVVEAKPGLRDPRKRLAGRKPTDPFEQRFTGPQLKGARLNGSTSTSTTTTTTTTTGSSAGSGTTAGGASPGTTPGAGTTPVAPPSTGTGSGHLTFFTFAIDVKVKLVPGEASGSSAASSTANASSSSSSSPSQPTVMHGVKPATPLPGKKAPVVTYMGSIDKAKTALFMVSPEVTSVFGDAPCLSGTNTCQLLGVEAGMPETFAYGFAHNRLKIEVLKIKPVVTGHS